MAKRRSSRVKAIPLTIGNDPSLWRYKSLEEALTANIDGIAQLIRNGQQLNAEDSDEVTDSPDSKKG